MDYRTGVTAVVPTIAGIHARYLADGSQLELRNDSGRTVEGLGYQGEPMLQVRPDGVWQSINAQSLSVDQLGIPVTSAANAHAAPHWRRASAVPIVRWQDHRALWHGPPPPTVRADPTRAHRVSDILGGGIGLMAAVVLRLQGTMRSSSRSVPDDVDLGPNT